MIGVPAFLRGRRGAFNALAIVGAAIFLFVVVPFVIDVAVQQQDIADVKAQITSAQAVLASRPMLEERLQALGADAATVPGLLSAGSAALAQAKLQSAMASIIAANGGTLVSAQLLPPIGERGFDVVAIRYDVTLPLSHLRSLIYGVETHTPYFFIDDADILIQPNWNPSAPGAPAPTVEVHWTVSAYRWSGSR
jgi:hypothetical protein